MQPPLFEWLDQALYGVGEAKTFAALLREIEQRECEIIWEDDRYVRLVQVVLVEVFSSAGKLIEDRQEFTDGRSRRRGIEGISEKRRRDENPLDAARRALREELGIAAAIDLTFVQQTTGEKLSPSYPGLLSRYTKDLFTCYLPDELIQPKYVEIQDDKKTFFVWKPSTHF
ncbi:MAG TPA: NUDIX domain-containing protein [Leptolyngbyaceae cyanobacterium M33_DOE_097]|uniref:Uncharacterized protein n=1 Tax=Oscillatoriales cyanobacterium SpSt-418 TaxID=2282169 RepID=A0A7C3KJA3_9CYAN|nr:NUDIX domain-containing protein [Leptolyngbyaceae cyanobacterium M33_DOE_097]